MNIGQKFFSKNGITWYCLSVFYSSDDLACLFQEVKRFYDSNSQLINYLHISISDKQGERLNIAIGSSEDGTDSTYSLINNYFSEFIVRKPSGPLRLISRKESLWGYYENNSIVWNCFNLPDFLSNSKLISDFSLYTSLLIIELYDIESNYRDNILSLNLFLTTKAYKQYIQNKLCETDDDSNHHRDNSSNTIIGYYWSLVSNANVEPLLNTWNNSISAIFNAYEKQIGFSVIHQVIFKQLNSNKVFSTKIIDLINSWALENQKEEITIIKQL